MRARHEQRRRAACSHAPRCPKRTTSTVQRPRARRVFACSARAPRVLPKSAFRSPSSASLWGRSHDESSPTRTRPQVEPSTFSLDNVHGREQCGGHAHSHRARSVLLARLRAPRNRVGRPHTDVVRRGDRREQGDGLDVALGVAPPIAPLGDSDRARGPHPSRGVARGSTPRSPSPDRLKGLQPCRSRCD